MSFSMTGLVNMRYYYHISKKPDEQWISDNYLSDALDAQISAKQLLDPLCINYVDNNEYCRNLAVVLNRIGDINRASGKLNLAESNYNEALKTLDSLIITSNNEYDITNDLLDVYASIALLSQQKDNIVLTHKMLDLSDALIEKKFEEFRIKPSGSIKSYKDKLADSLTSLAWRSQF